MRVCRGRSRDRTVDGLATQPPRKEGGQGATRPRGLSLPSRVTRYTAQCSCLHAPQGQPGLSPGHYPGPAAEPEMPPLGWDPPKPPSRKPCLFNKTEPAGPHRAPRIPSSPTPHTSSSKPSHFPGLCLSTYSYDFNASISRNGRTSYVRSLTKKTENMSHQVSSFLVQKTPPQFQAFVILN